MAVTLHDSSVLIHKLMLYKDYGNPCLSLFDLEQYHNVVNHHVIMFGLFNCLYDALLIYLRAQTRPTF